jgi:hypothetical protein
MTHRTKATLATLGCIVALPAYYAIVYPFVGAQKHGVHWLRVLVYAFIIIPMGLAVAAGVLALVGCGIYILYENFCEMFERPKPADHTSRERREMGVSPLMDTEEWLEKFLRDKEEPWHRGTQSHHVHFKDLRPSSAAVVPPGWMWLQYANGRLIPEGNFIDVPASTQFETCNG